MSDSDEYNAYDLSEFTQEDFASIDAALVLGSADINEPKGGPTVTIELEEPTQNLPLMSATPGYVGNSTELSPLRRYRPHKTLSVSDLVSPAWCEVQFDYGLRQKRSRKLEHRPESFVSGEGKEIFVEKAVAERNYQTTTRGQSVHVALEREIRPIQVHVDITTDEERWALRLVNMLSCLECLMSLGCAREMPVFGIIHDHVVVGIIDEILRKPAAQQVPLTSAKRPSESSHATPEPKKTRRTSSLSQAQNTPFFPTSPVVTAPATTVVDEPPSVPCMTPLSGFPSHQYTLHLLDTKTRRSNTLPSHEDTISSRLQLMLYHRLLSNLFSASPFDFSSLWARLELEPSKPFSTGFLLQVEMILDGTGISVVTCLDDLSQLWRDKARELDVPGIDNLLRLVYRTQPRGVNNRQKSRQKIPVTDTLAEIIGDQEAQDIAKAVAASLEDIRKVVGNEDIANALKESTQQSDVAGFVPDLGALSYHEPQIEGDNRALFGALQQSLTPSKHAGATDASTTPGTRAAEDSNADSSSKIIGTKEFIVDEFFLDKYLMDILQWWHGSRKPRGVEVEQSGRCFSCEYCVGCEWREAKAKEVEERFKKTSS